MRTMNRMFFLSMIMLFVLAFSGCKTYMHFKYGLTQPKEERVGKLTDFLQKHHFPADDQYHFSDSASYLQAIKNPMFSKYLLNHMIFDHNGVLLQNDTTQCQWSGYDLISSLSRDSVYALCTDLKLSQITSHIIPFSHAMTSMDTIREPDFTVIVTWAKFIGTYNSRLFALSEAVKHCPAHIRMIWLNVDMLESWKLKTGQKVNIREGQ